jgi:hypothetical protein
LLAWNRLNAEARLQLEIGALVGITGAPLAVVELPTFRRVLEAFVPDPEGPSDARSVIRNATLTRYRTRKALTDGADIIQNRKLREFAGLPSVSLAIDAGTLEHRHFLDIMVLAPYAGVKPLLY